MSIAVILQKKEMTSKKINKIFKKIKTLFIFLEKIQKTPNKIIQSKYQACLLFVKKIFTKLNDRNSDSISVKRFNQMEKLYDRCLKLHFLRQV